MEWQGRAGSPDGLSSGLPVRGKGLSRIAVIQQVNTWLSNCCHRQGFVSCDLGILFEKEGLLGRHGIHLTKEGDCIVTNRFGQPLL